MKLQHISSFLELCRDGNISRCSKRINITQQGLSRQILALEQELNVKLFTRSSKGVSLTESGQLILPHLEEIWNQYQECCQKLLKEREQKQSTLSLAFAPGVAQATGLDFLLEYQETHQDTAIEMRNMSDASCEAALFEGAIDAAMLICPENLEQYESHLVAQSQCCIVVNPTHPFAGRTSIHLQELKGQHLFIGGSEFRMRQLFEAHHPDVYEGTIIDLSSGDFQEYINLPLTKDGIAVTFTYLLRGMAPSLVAVPVEGADLFQVFCCCRKDRSNSLAFIDYLRHAFSDPIKK